MSRLLISMTLGAFALLGCMAAHGEDATAVFARFKATSGNARWDGVHSLQSTGTLSAGGLTGSFQSTVDLLSGRSTYSYKVGPVDGAAGYDGRTNWTRSPGGEVAANDDPAAIRSAHSQAWLDARGYWYAQRMAASYGKAEVSVLNGKTYRVITATPAGGDPIKLWFASDTGLLARIAQPEGGDVVTTVFDDYREVDGLRVPFHSAIDQTDAAGRTDPRDHQEIQFARVNVNVPVADRDFAMPAMAATARIDDPSGISRVPFDLVNNHIFVDGYVDGKPARFMVDTGGVNLLTPAASKRLGLVGEGKLAAGGAGEKKTDMAFARGKQLRVGTATQANPVFYVVDLGSLSQVEGVPLDGLVGYEMFRRFGVQIDYAKRQLTFSDPKKFTPPPGATVLSFDLNGSIPIISGVLDGMPVRLSVDTGSRDTLTMSSPFVRAHDLARKYAATHEAVIGWGVGGGVRGLPVRYGTLTLGNLHIDGIAGNLFTGDKGGFTDPDLAGNLGGGVLRRFTVAFDYANRKMYLAPNADFDKPDAFDRSGLWLLGDGNALKIVDVAADSAAERAGLRVDDRVVAIGGTPVSAKSLAEWRKLLRESPAGTKLAIRFRRNDRDNDATLTLADRIPPATTQ